jgi:hypothetical protein
VLHTISWVGTFSLLYDPGQVTKLLLFLLNIYRLQKVRRTGWVRCRVGVSGRVAGHKYRMGEMGLLMGGTEATVISLCLIWLKVLLGGDHSSL